MEKAKTTSLQDEGKEADTNQPGLVTPLLTSALLAALVVALPWARRWIYSGCAIESTVVLYGYGFDSRIFPGVNAWALLAVFNLFYAICSTSSLLLLCFAATCYPIILLTCLWQFPPAAKAARWVLRKWLQHLHFTRGKIAFFALPALEIDVDVDGLLVVRGITVSLTDLTIVAHGVELGIKLSPQMELALSVDEVTIELFRNIHIGEIYVNFKGEEVKRTFDKLEARAEADIKSKTVFTKDTPLLRAATAGSTTFDDDMTPQRSHTKLDQPQDYSARESLNHVTVLSPDEEQADNQYKAMLNNIRATSAVNQCRKKVRSDAQGRNKIDGGSERVAIITELQRLTSIPHPPDYSVRVTTIQALIPPRLRKYLHRLPLLVRLALAPLSYLHPLTIAHATAGVAGSWLAAVLAEKNIKPYFHEDVEIKRLEEKVTSWLADANFTLQLSNIDALAQVPFSTRSDISIQIIVKDAAAYRDIIGHEKIEHIIQLAGADGTFKIPSYMLPHHEHIVPAKPKGQQDGNAHPDGPNEEDEAQVGLTIHACLPAWLDESLLDFLNDLVKAARIINLVNDFTPQQQDDEASPEEESSTSPTSPDVDSGWSSTNSTPSSPTRRGRLKSFTSNMRHSLRIGTTNYPTKELAKHPIQATRDGVKKAVTMGVINDQWIEKVIGQVAAALEKTQGSFGYSGAIPVPLDEYRGPEGMPSKLLR